MELDKDSFIAEAKKSGISDEAAQNMWETLRQKIPEKPAPIKFPQLVYYFGALIIIAAMSWFFVIGWERFSGFGIFLIAAAYAICFTIAGRYWWNKGFEIPGGIFFTLAVCMVPLAIYGLELYFDLWINYKNVGTPGHFSISANNLFMEIGTIIAALIALWFVPFPFLMVPLFAAFWLMSLDLVAVIFTTLTGQDIERTSMLSGIIMMLAAYLIDGRTKRDFAFWGYLFGLAAFWTSWSFSSETGEKFWVQYLIMNLVLLFLAIILERRAFLIFGAVGAFLYFAHLIYDVFADSLWFPFALSFLGIAVIGLGILYQRHEPRIRAFFQDLIPEKWQRILLPQKRTQVD